MELAGGRGGSCGQRRRGGGLVRVAQVVDGPSDLAERRGKRVRVRGLQGERWILPWGSAADQGHRALVLTAWRSGSREARRGSPEMWNGWPRGLLLLWHCFAAAAAVAGQGGGGGDQPGEGQVGMGLCGCEMGGEMKVGIRL